MNAVIDAKALVLVSCDTWIHKLCGRLVPKVCVGDGVMRDL